MTKSRIQRRELGLRIANPGCNPLPSGNSLLTGTEAELLREERSKYENLLSFLVTPPTPAEPSAAARARHSVLRRGQNLSLGSDRSARARRAYHQERSRAILPVVPI